MGGNGWGALNVRRMGEARDLGPQYRYVRGSCRRDQKGRFACAVEHPAESGEVDRVQLIRPVAARICAARSGVDEEVALVADVIDGDGHIFGDGSLQASVIEGELRRTPSDTRVGIGDSSCSDELARTVDVEAR